MQLLFPLTKECDFRFDDSKSFARTIQSIFPNVVDGIECVIGIGRMAGRTLRDALLHDIRMECLSGELSAAAHTTCRRKRTMALQRTLNARSSFKRIYILRVIAQQLSFLLQQSNETMGDGGLMGARPQFLGEIVENSRIVLQTKTRAIHNEITYSELPTRTFVRTVRKQRPAVHSDSLTLKYARSNIASGDDMPNSLRKRG
jgi:hypothetical protein